MDSVLTFRTLTVFGIGKLQQKKVVALAVICMMVVFYLATFVNMKTDAEGKFARSSKKSPRKGFCEKRSSKFNSSLVRKDWDYKLFVSCLLLYFYFIYIYAFLIHQYLMKYFHGIVLYAGLYMYLIHKLIMEADLNHFLLNK